MKHILITIQPTLVKTMKPGDIFRDGGQNYQIAGIDCDEEAVEIAYYFGVGDLVNYFHLSPDDTLDKIIEVQE